MIVLPGDELSHNSKKRMQLAVLKVIGLKKTIQKEGVAKFEPNLVSLFGNMGRRNTVIGPKGNPQDVIFIEKDFKDHSKHSELA